MTLVYLKYPYNSIIPADNKTKGKQLPYEVSPLKVSFCYAVNIKKFYLTVILIFAFFPLNVFAVIVVVPRFFAVILPEAETDATDFLLEE